MKENIEVLAAYERKFDGRKFIHYKEDGKEYLTDGVIRHDKNLEKITSIMDKIDKFPIKELKEKNQLEEVNDVIKALEKLEKGEPHKQDKTTVALESTLDFQEPSAGFYTRLDGMDEKILYRLVKIAENGELEAYPDKSTIFENEQLAKEYIESHASELEVVRYDDLIFQAGVKTVENEVNKEQQSSKEVNQEKVKEDEIQKETGEQEKDKEQSEKKEEHTQENGKEIKVDDVTKELNKMYQEFEKNIFKYLNSLDKSWTVDSNLIKNNMRSNFENTISNAIKEPKEKEATNYNTPKPKQQESPLMKQLEHYKSSMKEIVGYVNNYNHNNSIYTQAGRDNLAKDLQAALSQVEKGINQVSDIVKQIMPAQENVPKREIGVEKSIDSFTNMSLNLYKEHGNFECTMAYMKEYAKQNGMSLSSMVLNTSDLKTKLETKSLEDIKSVFSQAINIGDRDYLSSVIKEGGFKPTNTLIDSVKSLNQHFGKDHSIKDIKNLFQNVAKLSGEDKKIVSQVGKTFQKEESMLNKMRAILPGK